jgi:16S rRNA (guanine(1405)-N(7))-methyltransferase
MPDPDLLEELVTSVQTGARYRQVSASLVRRIAAQELEKRRSLKEAVKAVRSKLHQVGGAYQEEPLPYKKWLAELENLPRHPGDPGLQDFCRRLMAYHASTRERLPIIAEFYERMLAPLAPIHSVLDLGCGLNPLALPWMPLAPGTRYHACDIYEDLVAFLNTFLAHMGQDGEARICDLGQGCPQKEVQVALLLKMLPCLEQQDKSIGLKLLQSIPAEHILVSFPARSLGGRSKGMVQNYEAHFAGLTAGQGWRIQRYEFASELAFLISR